MLGNVPARFIHVIRPYEARAYESVAHERWRLALLFAIAGFKLLNFLGGNWDIQWHLSIGRDSLFIPPHLMVLVAFGTGTALILYGILTESTLARAGIKLRHTTRFGVLEAPAPFWGVLLGYTGALLSGVFDEGWHRAFGIDATLWSPPHLCIMASTLTVDFSLLLGLAASARRLGAKLEWRSPLTWGVGLAGAYAFESVNFQMSQAFLEAYRGHGAGLLGLLFPILVGAFFPLSMVLSIRLAGHFRIVLLMFAIAFAFQLLGTGLAAAGLALLQPVSVIQEFVRENPDSYIAIARELVSQSGFMGIVGLQQAWALSLSALPLLLVALLDLSAWARPRVWIAAPVYSASLVIISFLMFQLIPLLRGYPIGGLDVLLGALLSAAAGLVLARVALRLARVALDPQTV